MKLRVEGVGVGVRQEVMDRGGGGGVRNEITGRGGGAQ